MSKCRYCGWIGGYHSAFCSRPEEPTTRIEWTGNVQVHHPVKK